MKKLKLALIAVGSVIGIGGAVAATSPGQYFTSASGSNVIPGQKDVDWICDTPQAPQETCAYLENPNGSRTKLVGHLEQQ